MEISIKIPFQYITKQTLKIDKEKFIDILIQFIDKLENDFYLDNSLYNELLEMGINKEIFEKMIEEVQVFASYDEDHNNIGFPYEDWIERLLEVCSDIKK